MDGGKKISLKDIASAAGFSCALVSMVLNGKSKQYGISDETSRRVLLIAKELNYQPNVMARGLRSGKSHLLGLVVADIANPFFSNLARGVETAAMKRGYTVIYGSSDETREHLRKLTNTLFNQGVDGLIIVPCEESEKIIESLRQQARPMVLVDRYFPNQKTSYVVLDNVKACSDITCYLLDKGFRKITFVAYESELQHTKDRIAGYEKAMSAAGLKPSVLTFRQKDFKEEMMPVLKKHLIDDGKQAEALVFSTNSLTIEGLMALRNLHLSIPEDIAVFGFDGGEAFDLHDPAISYVRQPVEEMGRTAVLALLEQINAQKPVSPKTIYLPADLICTDSCKKQSE